jgi:hypothetical protein
VSALYNGYGLALCSLLAFGCGFILAALLFLGRGQVRTTEDERNSLVADRRAARGRRCTSLSARWCPLHGECTCRIDGPDEDEMRELNMDDHDCSLHGRRSLHAT